MCWWMKCHQMSTFDDIRLNKIFCSIIHFLIIEFFFLNKKKRKILRIFFLGSAQAAAVWPKIAWRRLFRFPEQYRAACAHPRLPHLHGNSSTTRGTTASGFFSVKRQNLSESTDTPPLSMYTVQYRGGASLDLSSSTATSMAPYTGSCLRISSFQQFNNYSGQNPGYGSRTMHDPILPSSHKITSKITQQHTVPWISGRPSSGQVVPPTFLGLRTFGHSFKRPSVPQQMKPSFPETSPSPESTPSSTSSLVGSVVNSSPQCGTVPDVAEKLDLTSLKNKVC